MNAAFLRERVTATQSLIIAYETAMAQLASGVQSYTLDTGQSRQIVTKLDLNDLNATLTSLYNQLATIEARLTGGGTVTVTPAW